MKKKNPKSQRLISKNIIILEIYYMYIFFQHNVKLQFKTKKLQVQELYRCIIDSYQI